MEPCKWCLGPPAPNDTMCAVCGPVARGPSFKCSNPDHLPTLYGTGEPVCADCEEQKRYLARRKEDALHLRSCAEILADGYFATPSPQESNFYEWFRASLISDLSRAAVALGGEPFTRTSLRPQAETAYDYQLRGSAALANRRSQGHEQKQG